MNAAWKNSRAPMVATNSSTTANVERTIIADENCNPEAPRIRM